MRFGATYNKLKQMQDVLLRIICDEKTPARDMVRCVTAFISLEKFKREIRGIPPLAPASVKELLEMKRERSLKRARTIPMPFEVQEHQSLNVTQCSPDAAAR
jgi:hypothetical protein